MRQFLVKKADNKCRIHVAIPKDAAIVPRNFPLTKPVLAKTANRWAITYMWSRSGGQSSGNPSRRAYKSSLSSLPSPLFIAATHPTRSISCCDHGFEPGL
jgi:hypothetical protein